MATGPALNVRYILLPLLLLCTRLSLPGDTFTVTNLQNSGNGSPRQAILDAGDFGLGANNRQNSPVLTAAWNLGFATLIQGTLNSRSSTTCRLEFFVNMVCHASGFGPGRALLGAST